MIQWLTGLGRLGRVLGGEAPEPVPVLLADDYGFIASRRPCPLRHVQFRLEADVAQNVMIEVICGIDREVRITGIHAVVPGALDAIPEIWLTNTSQKDAPANGDILDELQVRGDGPILDNVDASDQPLRLCVHEESSGHTPATGTPHTIVRALANATSPAAQFVTDAVITTGDGGAGIRSPVFPQIGFPRYHLALNRDERIHVLRVLSPDVNQGLDGFISWYEVPNRP